MRSNFATGIEVVLLLCKILHYVVIPLIVNEWVGKGSLNRLDRLIGEKVVNGGTKRVRDRGIRELLGHYHSLL